MGGKSSTPPPPDYAGAAQQQAQSSKEVTNIQNYANRPDQYTPWGSTTWGQEAMIDPSTGQEVTRWTQQQQLSPLSQQALDQQLMLQNQRSQLAGGFMGRVAESYAQPFDWTNLPGTAGTPQGQMTGTYQAQQFLPGQQPFDTSAPMQTTSAQGGAGLRPTGQHTQGVPSTTETRNAANFVNERRRIEDQMFNRMRPEHQRQEDSVRTMLANQGLTPGSEAYNRELERLGDQQSRERYNAMQQGSAEQQAYQNMLMGQQQQAFSQDMSSQAQQNAALQNLFQQRQAAGQYGLSREQQAFGQDMAAQQAYNQALGQQYNQDLSRANFYNQAQQQMYGQQLGANAQNFNQMQQMADYQNKLRQQAISEQAMQRGMSLNEMNALLTGQQVSTPSMPGFQTAQASQPLQALQAAQMQGQYGLQAAKMENESSNSMFGGLGQLAGTAGMMFMMSDARLKSNIVRVGTHPCGVGIYEYDIFGRRERGIMAHELLEVRPELVALHSSGYLMVNYGGL